MIGVYMNIAIYIYITIGIIYYGYIHIYIYIYWYISGNPTGKDPKVNTTDTVIYSYLFGLLYMIYIYIDTHIMVVCISYFPNMDITRDRMGYCQWTSYGCSFNNETSRNHLGFLRMHIELWYLDNGRSMDIPWECEQLEDANLRAIAQAFLELIILFALQAMSAMSKKL